MGTGRQRWMVHHGRHSAPDDQPSCPLLSGNLSELPRCRRWAFWGVTLSAFCFLLSELTFCGLRLLSSSVSAVSKHCCWSKLTSGYAAMLSNDYWVSGLTLKCGAQRRSSPEIDRHGKADRVLNERTLIGKCVCVFACEDEDWYKKGTRLNLAYLFLVLKRFSITDQWNTAYLTDACSVL